MGATPLDSSALEEASGVGVVVKDEQIQAAVADVIKEHIDRLQEER